MRAALGFVIIAGLVPAAGAAGLDLQLQIPRLDVAEYHRPYLAVWVEREDQSVAANLVVWYETGNKEGTKWLADLRQWWRRTGREQQFPMDGVTGATRPAGQHQLAFTSGKPPLGTLAPGKYVMVVEAAREVGGREVLRLPFDWPATATKTVAANGKTELGNLQLTVKP